MDNTQIFETFMVKVIDGKHKAEFVEMNRAELLTLMANIVVNKVEVIRPDRSRVSADRNRHPLDLVANAPSGSIITIKKE